VRLKEELTNSQKFGASKSQFLERKRSNSGVSKRGDAMRTCARFLPTNRRIWKISSSNRRNWLYALDRQKRGTLKGEKSFFGVPQIGEVADRAE